MQDYLIKLQEAFPHKTEPELELFCSASRQIQKQTGLSGHDHRRRAMEKLFPNRVWHEWREERMQSVQYCLERGIQELMWGGASNSNKSGDAADIAITLWLTRPEMTSIYIASPFESATNTGIWAEIQDQFTEAKNAFPSIPGKVRHSDNSIVLFDRNPRSFIRVATVDQVGKLVGKKSRNAESGLLVFIIDELPAFMESASRQLMSTMANLISVKNLLVIGTGNFASTWDAFGQFCHPNEDDIPNGYEGFNPDMHFRWRTKRGGLCLRFDGLQSPNVKAGKDIYPFLTTNAYIAKLAAAPGGLQSADAMRFIRSAPITNLELFNITSPERIRAGGCYDEVVWTGDAVQRGAFIDPGFGGDPCVLQKFKLGTAIIGDTNRQVFSLWEPPVTIPVRIAAKRDDGQPWTAEEQIVERSRDHCRANLIPDENVGFDGSMRSHIVQKFGELYSPRVKAYDTQGPATDRKVNASEEAKWKDRVDRLISEEWFVVAMLIDSGQFRGLGMSPRALEQFCTRQWKPVGKAKKSIQTKAEYKSMLVARGRPGESPNEADAVVGCVEIARGLGLQLNALVVNGGSVALLLNLRAASDDARALEYARTMGRTELPAGRLHAIRREVNTRNTLRSGKLHRSIS